VEYRSEEADDALRSRGVFERLRSVIAATTANGGPHRPVECLEALEAHRDVVGAAMGPDMRYTPP